MALVTVVAFAADKAVNSKCPLSKQDVNPEVTSHYVKYVGVCCNNCAKKFDASPAEHAAKVKGEAKPVNKVCPVSNKAIDATKTVTYKGEIIAFCCGNCPKKFESDPEAVAAKVKREPTAVNDKCPFTGKDVAKVVSYKAVVGFCCENCQGKFDKDPDAHIGKVEASK
jgi:YHS domain-containing protein